MGYQNKPTHMIVILDEVPYLDARGVSDFFFIG